MHRLRLNDRLGGRLRSSYLKRRILAAVLVFFIVYVINFILPRLEPGNVVAALASSELLPQQRQQIINILGINKPLWQQFEIYVRQTFGSFPPNFGVSFSYYPLSVWTIVTAALPWTLLLVGVSQIIAWSGGVLAGAWLAWHRDQKSIHSCLESQISCGGYPSYWLATILIYIFAISITFFRLHWSRTARSQD